MSAPSEPRGDDPEVAAAKRVLRREARARRQAAASPEATDAALNHLAGFLAAHEGRPLSAYLPIESEIDARPFMLRWPGPVGVPIVDGPRKPLRFALWNPDTATEGGPLGTQVPIDAEPMRPEVLIVPLLAFDAAGRRLGYGGGYYDRTLAGLRAEGPVVAVGLAYAAQEFPEVPHGPTDQPLDAIATEAGLYRF